MKKPFSHFSVFFCILKLITLLGLSENVFAAGGGGSGEIPWGMIGLQALNLSIMVGILTFFLRKKLATFFKGRSDQFNDLVVRADQALIKAESNKKEIEERLTRLQSDAQAGLKKAKSEAVELRQRIVKDGEALAKNLEIETQRTIQFELEKAKHSLAQELFNQALGDSKAVMKERLGQEDQKNLSDEFVQKIQVARS